MLFYHGLAQAIYRCGNEGGSDDQEEVKFEIRFHVEVFDYDGVYLNTVPPTKKAKTGQISISLFKEFPN